MGKLLKSHLDMYNFRLFGGQMILYIISQVDNVWGAHVLNVAFLTSLMFKLNGKFILKEQY